MDALYIMHYANTTLTGRRYHTTWGEEAELMLSSDGEKDIAEVASKLSAEIRPDARVRIYANIEQYTMLSAMALSKRLPQHDVWVIEEPKLSSGPYRKEHGILDLERQCRASDETVIVVSDDYDIQRYTGGRCLAMAECVKIRRAPLRKGMVPEHVLPAIDEI